MFETTEKFPSSHEEVSFAATALNHSNLAMRICEAQKSYDVSVQGKGDFYLSLHHKRPIPSTNGLVAQPRSWFTKVVQYVSVEHVNHTMFLRIGRAIFCFNLISEKLFYSNERVLSSRGIGAN